MRKGKSVAFTGHGAWQQGRLTKVFCHRAEDQPEVLELMEEREKRRASWKLIGFVAGKAS